MLRSRLPFTETDSTRENRLSADIQRTHFARNPPFDLLDADGGDDSS